jgi:hypothetical protein
MARPESVAIGGYFSTPRHLIPRIAPLVQPFISKDSQVSVSFMDPCAGDGEAVLALMKLLSKGMHSRLYACEMETTRYAALSSAVGAIKYAVHCDAFRVSFQRRAGVSLLFLNPPYDFDRVHGRLEQKFLARFTEALADRGILLFVVPFYALKASANELATHYENVRCFKFPDQDFAAFKQVVLFAQRVEARLQPDQEIVRQVERYAEGEGLLELPYIGAAPLAALPETERHADPLTEWVVRETDVAGLLKKIRPWVSTGRNGAQNRIPGILPELPIDELLLRTYPVATPPRPAHIASGIASGIFNGSRVTSDNSTLPPLLVKGVFNQEYRTVEEKTDKHGIVKAWVQVQQPKLVVTVLDLSTYRYQTLSNDGEFTGTIDTLSVSGLLKYYGSSLMRVMERQCPILYDPRRDRNLVPLASTARTPFLAQSDAAKALVMLLGGPGISLKNRRGKSAFLLGEIGSGKTTVSLVVAKTVGAQRPLVICPPHLLKSWSDEIAKVLPEAEVRILTEVSDLEALALDESDKMIVSILSRETAKLGHGWISVGDVCPRCGALTPDEDHAKKRSRCEAQALHGNGLISRTVLQLVHYLKRFAPSDDTIQSLLKQRWGLRSIAWHKANIQEFPGLPAGYLDAVIRRLQRDAQSEGYADEPLRRALAWCLIAVNDHAQIAAMADYFLGREPTSDQEFGRQLLYILPPGSALQNELVERHRKVSVSYLYSPWAGFEKAVEDAQKGSSYVKIADLSVSWEQGKLTIGGVAAASLEAACRATRALKHRSNIRWGAECGEFLFQAVPEPRRVALAKHIQDRYPTTFDLLVLDECHEYGTEGSAQEKSAHRLTGLGLPTIQMSGSIMNGYAEHLFMTTWSVSPAFRKEFARADKQRFIDRYGYRKRLVTERDEDDVVISFGSVSDRENTTARVIGNAPGVLPLFLLRHLLPLSVTLHKADLALDLPKCVQERHLIDPGPVLKARYDVLKKALINRIKKDKFDAELSGKLFGQLAELPSFLDRATVDLGNSDSGAYEIRYPESIGGGIVASQEGLPASTILPKEQWMLDRIKSELAEGRNVMVFSWHVSLLPRIAGLISEAIGQKVPILYANKVGTAKRQEWITKNVVQKNARVMVTNPVAIQTGLNNLVHFSTEIWLENPVCNPIVYRQATGRVDRIGQNKETRILFPIYKDTLQVQLHELLLRKVAISTATDGLDPESSLLASGVGPDDYLTGLSIGKQLWAMLSSNQPAQNVSTAAQQWT